MLSISCVTSGQVCDYFLPQFISRTPGVNTSTYTTKWSWELNGLLPMKDLQRVLSTVCGGQLGGYSILACFSPTKLGAHGAMSMLFPPNACPGP